MFLKIPPKVLLKYCGFGFLGFGFLHRAWLGGLARGLLVKVRVSFSLGCQAKVQVATVSHFMHLGQE